MGQKLLDPRQVPHPESHGVQVYVLYIPYWLTTSLVMKVLAGHEPHVFGAPFDPKIRLVPGLQLVQLSFVLEQVRHLAESQIAQFKVELSMY